MIGFRRKPEACSDELRESAARTAQVRQEVESRWPEVMELVAFAEGRLIENHIGRSITESMQGITQHKERRTA